MHVGTTILCCKHLPNHVLRTRSILGSLSLNAVEREILWLKKFWECWNKLFCRFIHNRIHRVFVMPRGCVILLGHAVCGVWSYLTFEPLYVYVNNSWETSVLQNQFKKKHVKKKKKKEKTCYIIRTCYFKISAKSPSRTSLEERIN